MTPGWSWVGATLSCCPVLTAVIPFSYDKVRLVSCGSLDYSIHFLFTFWGLTRQLAQPARGSKQKLDHTRSKSQHGVNSTKLVHFSDSHLKIR